MDYKQRFILERLDHHWELIHSLVPGEPAFRLRERIPPGTELTPMSIEIDAETIQAMLDGKLIRVTGIDPSGPRVGFDMTGEAFEMLTGSKPLPHLMLETYKELGMIR